MVRLNILHSLDKYRLVYSFLVSECDILDHFVEFLVVFVPQVLVLQRLLKEVGGQVWVMREVLVSVVLKLILFVHEFKCILI